MKLENNALLATVKPLSLALLLAFGMSTSMAADEMATPADNAQNVVIDSETSMVNTTPEVYDNDSWQTPTVTEFNKLDRTGNGLLLPNEASKGKAFNKKTFKQADTDNDGSIDVNEYIFFKTGKAPEAAKPAISAAPDESMLENTP
jgi:EF hand